MTMNIKQHQCQLRLWDRW